MTCPTGNGWPSLPMLVARIFCLVAVPLLLTRLVEKGPRPRSCVRWPNLTSCALGHIHRYHIFRRYIVAGVYNLDGRKIVGKLIFSVAETRFWGTVILGRKGRGKVRTEVSSYPNFSFERQDLEIACNAARFFCSSCDVVMLGMPLQIRNDDDHFIVRILDLALKANEAPFRG